MYNTRSGKIYYDLTEVYDYLMRTVRYDHWADYIFRISSKYLSAGPELLELGAGNCNLARYIKKRYPHIVATDISSRMLSYKKKYKIKRVCCDMTFLPFKCKFDLVFSTFDSVNYILTKKKLLQSFKEIYDVMTEDAIFTFDVSMEKNSMFYVKKPLRTGNFNGVKFTQESKYNPETRIHKNIFNLQLGNGRKIREIHKQKIHKFEDYFILLDKAGLYVTECLEAFTFKDGDENSRRLQFITKRIVN